MKVSVVWIRAGGTRRKKGDWSRSTESACFRVPSNTGSPVVLAKSASTTVSFSVRALARRERKNKPPPITAAINTAAAIAGGFHDLFGAAGGVPPPGITVADEPAPTPPTEPDDIACPAGLDPESFPLSTAPYLSPHPPPVTP